MFSFNPTMRHRDAVTNRDASRSVAQKHTMLLSHVSITISFFCKSAPGYFWSLLPSAMTPWCWGVPGCPGVSRAILRMKQMLLGCPGVSLAILHIKPMLFYCFLIMLEQNHCKAIAFSFDLKQHHCKTNVFRLAHSKTNVKPVFFVGP